MDVDFATIRQWLEVILSGGALYAGILTAIWAYTKFIIERGFLPPAQFDIDCRKVGYQAESAILEILLHLKNLGKATLVATNLRLDLRYLDSTDQINLFSDAKDRRYGRLDVPRSLKDDLVNMSANNSKTEDIRKENQTKKERWTIEGRGIPIMRYDTFVQAGVDQIYSFITTVPKSASFVQLWSSFNYAQSPSRLQGFIVRLSRRLGLIQFSLKHLYEPHTAERMFMVQ